MPHIYVPLEFLHLANHTLPTTTNICTYHQAKVNHMDLMSTTNAAATVNIDDEREKVLFRRKFKFLVLSDCFTALFQFSMLYNLVLQFDWLCHVIYHSQQVLDDDFLNKFKIATVNDKSISYIEEVLSDEEETVRTIKSMDGHYDLYIVGKGRGMVSPLTAGLADWCDCPELGAIGDLLVTSEFSSVFSVLVVQQYIRLSESKDGSIRSGGSVIPGEEIEQVEWQVSVSVSETDEFGSFKSDGDREHLN